MTRAARRLSRIWRDARAVRRSSRISRASAARHRGSKSTFRPHGAPNVSLAFLPDGNLLTGNFADYGIISAAELPDNLGPARIVIVDMDDARTQGRTLQFLDRQAPPAEARA